MNYVDNTYVKENDELRNMVADILGRWLFSCPVRLFAEDYSATGNNVYAVVFAHRSEKSRSPKWFGATHLGEVQFVFGIPFLHPSNYTDIDREFSADAMKIVASFARSGKPTLPDGKELPKFTPKQPDFMWLEAGNYTIAHNFASTACDLLKHHHSKEQLEDDSSKQTATPFQDDTHEVNYRAKVLRRRKLRTQLEEGTKPNAPPPGSTRLYGMTMRRLQTQSFTNIPVLHKMYPTVTPTATPAKCQQQWNISSGNAHQAAQLLRKEPNSRCPNSAGTQRKLPIGYSKIRSSNPG
ncbi:hypothetical protein HPB50_002782 [Hyalomma asiaticum]|uniref:Uncharacterized protein n=1 Tax=Hyalomma asiaticum TaxID=266040 RepID=A0ACB7SA11_HYAAI|nr:hypothetical protein HPB50_002782 [Hyalomma asiaticum]